MTALRKLLPHHRLTWFWRAPLALCVFSCFGCMTTVILIHGYSVHPAYNTRVTLEFTLGKETFTATRYATVNYLTGMDTASNTRFTCPVVGEPTCVYQLQNHAFFVGLPDGNIALAIPDNRFFSKEFSHRAEGDVWHTTERLYVILSDDPPSDPLSLGATGCYPMEYAAMAARYGRSTDGRPGYSVDFKFQRLRNDEAMGKGDDPEYFLHGPKCAALISRASRDVLVTAAP